MNKNRNWYLIIFVSLFLSLLFLGYIALIFNRSMQDLLSTQIGIIASVILAIIKPISIIIIIFVIISIFKNKNIRSEKKLMMFLIVVLFVQILSHSFAFWYERQATEDLHRTVIERLLNEIEK